jgi:hypothetical protein
MAPKTKTGEHKFTANEVEQNCPANLEKLAKQITECLAKAEKSKEKAEQIVSDANDKAQPHYDQASDHRKEAGKLLVEAYKACNQAGFKVFGEKFFPDLQRTRIYELMQVAVGKKTMDEIKAANRARVAKHRAGKKGKAAAPSVTPTPVTDKPEPIEGAGAVPAPAIAEPAVFEPTKPVLNVVDTALEEFTGLVARLRQITDREPARFAKTPHPAEAFIKLGMFFAKLAELKQSPAAVGLKEVA